MYRAKPLGGGRFEAFDVALRHQLVDRMTIEGDLRHAKEYLDEAEDFDDVHVLLLVVRQYYDATQVRLKEERQSFRQQQKKKSRKSKRK